MISTSKIQIWQQLGKARELLLQGIPVGVPTETVYGLAAPINHQEGIKKIFALKERPFFDPLIVHVSSFSEVLSVAETFHGLSEALAFEFWPGPLTVVLPKRADLDPLICSGLDTVGVRFPSHPVFRRLIRTVQTPLAAPSANKFGKTSPTQAEHVRAEWPNGEVYVVEGGSAEVGIESTVIRVDEKRLVVEILRPGYISEADLRVAAQKYDPRTTVIRKEASASPGHLPYHYQPSLPLVIVPPGGSALSDDQLHTCQRELGLKDVRYEVLRLPERPELAARELYRLLRNLSQKEVGFLVVERMNQSFSSHLSEERDFRWDAIWDRLERASSFELKGNFKKETE